MLVTTLSEIREVVSAASKEQLICVDLETTGLDYVDDRLIGVGLAIQGHEWYIDFLEADVPDSFILDTLEPLFDLREHTLVSHNTPFDLQFLWKAYTEQGRTLNWFDKCLGWWDTLSMAALADENLIGVKVTLPREDGTNRRLGGLSLKALSKIFLDREQGLYEEDFESWTPEQRAEYGCADVRNCYDLATFFSQYLKKVNLWEYYQKYVAPMTFVTSAMEMRGLNVDVPKLLTIQEEVGREIERLVAEVQAVMGDDISTELDANQCGLSRAELAEHLSSLVQGLDNPSDFMTAAGNVSTSKSNLMALAQKFPDDWTLQSCRVEVRTPRNPRSYQQLGDYLSSRGYRLPLTPSGNPSVTAAVLEDLARQHPDEPVFGPLFKMRKLEKLKGTYIDACLEMAWEDNTVHPQWHQAGTVTGRYSCSTSSNNKTIRHKRGPALQTIPRPDTIADSGWPYNPREWFIAKPGHVLCVADLSQAEVRMLAVMSGDKKLTWAVNSGEDLHSSIAANVWGQRWADASAAERKVLRTHTKMVTFGTIYGIGPSSLAESLGIDLEAAARLLNDFYDAFPGVVAWKARETNKLMREKYVTSMLGRRRSPVILQSPPRVSGKPGTSKYRLQKLAESLWRAEYETALKKSGFDSEEVTREEIEGRAQRQAINFEVQGSVAELINYGLWRLVREGYTVCGQIHDEVIVEIEDTEQDRERLKDFLEKIYNVNISGVQFKIDVAFGKSWACGKE